MHIISTIKALLLGSYWSDFDHKNAKGNTQLTVSEEGCVNLWPLYVFHINTNQENYLYDRKWITKYISSPCPSDTETFDKIMSNDEQQISNKSQAE